MPSLIGNFFIRSIVNSPLHPLLGDSFGVITVTGVRTGRRYATPINIQPQGNGWIVVSMRERTWWRNLRQGRTAVLRTGGRKLSVRAEVIEGQDQVAAGLAAYFRQYPGYAKYFKVQLDPHGGIVPSELERLAAERVLIRLDPL